MKKIFAALLAVMMVISSLAACSGSDSQQGEQPQTTTDPSQTVAPLAVPDDKQTLVAYVEGAEDAEHFNITFEQFYREYIFYLMRKGLDETLAQNAEACLNIRQSTIDYLTLERITLKIAKDMGITEETLTQEEKDEIEAEVNDSYDLWCEEFEQDAIAELGEGYTEEELYNKEYELFAEYLAQAGLVPEIFHEWQVNSVLQAKLYEKIIAEIKVTDEEIDEYVNNAISEAKDAYENELEKYEQGYTSVYLPEGTKTVKQIFIKLEDADISEIVAYRNDGDDETADKIKAEKLAEIEDEAKAALDELKSGTAWDDVQVKYNDDNTGNASTYVVYPKSNLISEEIINGVMSLENKGDFTELISTDAGYYIFLYLDDAKVDLEAIRKQVQEGMLSQKQTEAANNSVLDWQKQYPYTINYELLDIPEPEETTAATEATTAE